MILTFNSKICVADLLFFYFSHINFVYFSFISKNAPVN